MGNKKIWAYAKDVDGEYIIGDKHPLKIYYIWEALKLKKSNIHEFNKLKFMSTHKLPEKRVELSVVKTGFYRYKKSASMLDWTDGDSDSLSHSIAIQVLAEMDEINFKVSGNKEFTIIPKSIRTDDLKIQLTNKDKYAFYYPDIICEFEEPVDLAQKWGGKLALEVKHTHACEAEKIRDFENHGIPIIEINIGNISIEKKFKIKNPTPDDLENYFSYLKRTFKNQVFGGLLSNPVSVCYFNRIVDNKNNEIKKLKHEVKLLKDNSIVVNEELEKSQQNTKEITHKLSQSMKRYKESENKYIELETECSKYLFEIEEYRNKVNIMEQRGIKYYLLNLLKSKR